MAYSKPCPIDNTMTSSSRFQPLVMILCLMLGLFFALPLRADHPISPPLGPESVRDDLMPESKQLLQSELELSMTDSGRTVAMNLDQAVQRALSSDPLIKSGYETIRQAEADLVTAGLLPNPNLVSDYLMVPWARPFTYNKQGGPTQTDTLLYMPIDWLIFGKRTAEIVAAQKGVDVTSAQYADMVRLRIGQTVSAFYDVIEAKLLLDFAYESLQRLTDIRAVHQKNGGETLDEERLRLATFTVHRDIRFRHMEYSVALSQLRSFMGFEDDTEIRADGSLKITKMIEPPSIEEVYDLALQHRPDLQAVQHQIDMADKRIEVEERRALPKISPGFGYTKQFQNEMNQPNASSWNVMLNMNIPVFDLNQGNIEKATSLKVQSVHNRTALLINLRNEVTKTVKNFDNAWEALTIDDPGRLESARTVMQQISKDYEKGRRPLIDVLDAFHTFSDTYKLHISGYSLYWHSLNQLNVSIGAPLYK